MYKEGGEGEGVCIGVQGGRRGRERGEGGREGEGVCIGVQGGRRGGGSMYRCTRREEREGERRREYV